MKILNRLKSKTAIYKTGKLLNIKTQTVISEIEDALTAAWLSDDPTTRAMQSTLFPDGKPTPEEFIEKLAALIKANN